MKKLLAMGCLFLAACSSMHAQKADPSQKTEVEMILHARKGSLSLKDGQGVLRLMDADQNISLLSIPPDRKIGVTLLKQETVQKWNEQFATSAPNGSLFYFTNDQATSVPLKLKSFASDGHGNLSFQVEALDAKDQNRNVSFEQSSLFVDASYMGMPGGSELWMLR